MKQLRWSLTLDSNQYTTVKVKHQTTELEQVSQPVGMSDSTEPKNLHAYD